MSDGAVSSAWTYFRLRAKHWVADITRVAVGTKCCALDLKVGILLHEKKERDRNFVLARMRRFTCMMSFT